MIDCIDTYLTKEMASEFGLPYKKELFDELYENGTVYVTIGYCESTENYIIKTDKFYYELKLTDTQEYILHNDLKTDEIEEGRFGTYYMDYFDLIKGCYNIN
jgi:hypothetical protein